MADVPQSDDAPRLAVQLGGRASEVKLSLGSRILRLDIAIVVADLPHQRKGRSDGCFRYGMGRVAYGVFHRDALFGSGFEVDVIHPRASDANHPQLWQRLHCLTVERHLVGDDDFGFAAAVDHLVTSGGFVARVVAQGFDSGQVGSAETVSV